MRTIAVFSCLLAFNFLFSTALVPPSEAAWVWNFCWLLAGSGTCMLICKKKKTAAILISLSFLGSLPACFSVPDRQGVFWIVQFIALLSYVWPLRFIAAGEFCLAWIFGPGFWWGYARLSEADTGLYGNLIPVMSGISAFSFFLSAFLANLNDYRRQKGIQQFSLPVLLGNIFASLDPKWERFSEKGDGRILWLGPLLHILSASSYFVMRNTFGFLP